MKNIYELIVVFTLMTQLMFLPHSIITTLYVVERRDKSAWSRLGNVCYCLLVTFSLAVSEGRQAAVGSARVPAWPGWRTWQPRHCETGRVITWSSLLSGPAQHNNQSV